MEELTLVGLSHLFVKVCLSGFETHAVSPALTDVTLLAVCPGRDECSLAIYLSGIQQAVAAFVSILAAVYMKVFLKEGIHDSDGLMQPILEGGSCINHNDGDNSRKPVPGFKEIPSVGDIIFLVKSRNHFTAASHTPSGS